MFIVYSMSAPEETWCFATREEAYERALEITRKTDISFSVYKANLIGVAEKAITITKIRKQKVKTFKKVFLPGVGPVDAEDFNKVLQADIGHIENKRIAKEKVKPVLDPTLLEIAQEVVLPQEEEFENQNDIPLGVRCDLDNNMAVAKKKGPTGEVVYLCVDCMGGVIE